MRPQPLGRRAGPQHLGALAEHQWEAPVEHSRLRRVGRLDPVA